MRNSSLLIEAVLIVTSTLVKTPHSEDFIEYVEEEGVEHFRILIPAHKNASSIIPIDTLLETLRIILNRAKHPLLIHCNKGKVHTKLPCQLRLSSNIVNSIERGVWLLVTEN